MITKKKSPAIRYLESFTSGPLTFASMIESKRLSEKLSQSDFARKLNVSRQYLNDIEKGRRSVSPKKASQWARTLGYGETHWVKLALQDQVDRAGLKLRITGVEAA